MQSGLRERIRDHRERLRRGMCREVGSVAGKEWTETGTPEGTTNAEWVCVYLAVPTRYGARQGLLVVPKVVLFFFNTYHWRWYSILFSLFTPLSWAVFQSGWRDSRKVALVSDAFVYEISPCG